MKNKHIFAILIITVCIISSLSYAFAESWTESGAGWVIKTIDLREIATTRQIEVLCVEGYKYYTFVYRGVGKEVSATTIQAMANAGARAEPVKCGK